MLNLLMKKENSLTKSNTLEAHQTLICCNHQQPCNLVLDNSCGQLRKTKIGRLEVLELAVTGVKIFDYLKKKYF